MKKFALSLAVVFSLGILASCANKNAEEATEDTMNVEATEMVEEVTPESAQAEAVVAEETEAPAADSNATEAKAEEAK